MASCARQPERPCTPAGYWPGLVPLSALVAAHAGVENNRLGASRGSDTGTPVDTRRGPLVKLQNPLPAPAPVADKNGKNGTGDKYSETGPELPLGDCVAIALGALTTAGPQAQLKNSNAATEAGLQGADQLRHRGYLP